MQERRGKGGAECAQLRRADYVGRLACVRPAAGCGGTWCASHEARDVISPLGFTGRAGRDRGRLDRPDIMSAGVTTGLDIPVCHLPLTYLDWKWYDLRPRSRYVRG